MSSGRHEITPLYHKIVAVNAVKTENQLSSMDRAGGINIHPINRVDIAWFLDQECGNKLEDGGME